jgi:hypothetical protein
MSFKAGDRVRFLYTSDPYPSMKPGQLGTVDSVDEADLGDGVFHQIWVRWDGSEGVGMALIPEFGDRLELVKEAEE